MSIQEIRPGYKNNAVSILFLDGIIFIKTWNNIIIKMSVVANYAHANRLWWLL